MAEPEIDFGERAGVFDDGHAFFVVDHCCGYHPVLRLLATSDYGRTRHLVRRWVVPA